MTRKLRIGLSIVSILFLVNCLQAQTILDQAWDSPRSKLSYSEAITLIEENYGLSFSYSPQILDNDIEWDLSDAKTLKDVFDFIFVNEGVSYEFSSPKRILLFKEKRQRIQVSGVVRDKESKETIPNAILYVQETGKLISSTDEGYFFFSVNDEDKVKLFVSSISFYPLEMEFDQSQFNIVIELEFKNEVPEIIITSMEDSIFQAPPPTKIRIPKLNEGFSTFGQREVLEQIKEKTEVQAGNEAQTGIIVKGGGPDQNLILLDGMPIFESSHIGGVSSIFVSPAVKDIQFYSGGFPANYSGRLSSVMDVKINEGNTRELESEVNLSFSGAEAHIEGPLRKDKTAVSLSGRLSWLGLLARPIFENTLGYENSKINFYDFYAKLHHKFSPTNRISLTYYRGNDQFSLDSEELISNVSNTTFNDLNWGNEALSFQWTRVIGEKVFFKSRTGYSNYSYQGESRYSQTFFDDNYSQAYEVLNKSQIRNFVIGSELILYDTPLGKLSGGFNFNNYFFNPSLVEISYENGEFVDGTAQQDAQTDATEYNLFFQTEARLSERVSLHAGINWSKYEVDSTNYFNLDPRVELRYKTKDHAVYLRGSFMHQYLHLLLNPGPGLPSDLWVPSNNRINPSKAREISLEYKGQAGSHLGFGTHFYYKTLTDIKDFIGTSDVFFALLNEDLIVPTISKELDWTERVSEGNGYSYGMGAFLQYKSEKYDFIGSYMFSRALHTFENINNGQEFPSRYDRPHNLNVQVGYRLNSKWSFFTKFVYGSGFRFTLPKAKFREPDGTVKFLVPPRNNQRIDDYSHLDFSAQYRKELKRGTLEVRIGVYNALNRFNPFYVYLFQPGDIDTEVEQRQVSLFPRIPNLVLSYSL